MQTDADFGTKPGYEFKHGELGSGYYIQSKSPSTVVVFGVYETLESFLRKFGALPQIPSYLPLF
jgi:hypothetical protein